MTDKKDYLRVLGFIKDSSQLRGAKRILDFIEPLFFKTKADISKYHQIYEGGLADHTFLAILDAYYESIVKSFYLGVDPDDVILATFFHDFDKIKRYNLVENVSDAERIIVDAIPVIDPADVDDLDKVEERRREDYLQHLSIVRFCSKYVKMNDQIANGIINSHGGWSGRKDHKAIALVVHNADMIASHKYAGKEETIECIEKLKKVVFNGVLTRIRSDIDEASGVKPWT